MRRRYRLLRPLLIGQLAFALTCRIAAGAPVDARPGASTPTPALSAAFIARLDRIVELTEESNVPELVGSERWCELVDAYRPYIERAQCHCEFAEAVNALFRAGGISHFHYYTDDDWLYWLVRSTFEAEEPEFEHIGLYTERIDGRWFVRGVLEGSPAAATRIRAGDELLLANGLPFEPVASFRGKEGQPVRLRIRRRPQLLYNIIVTPVKESLSKALERAIQRSIRVIDHNGYRFAYVHTWTLLGSGEEYPRLLQMQNDVDGLLLDFRDGVGGVTSRAMRFLFGPDGEPRRHKASGHWTKPVVILIADGTRSAKELVVDEAKRRKRALLVGTPTPGEVTSVGGIRRVGSDAVLMLPGHRFALEGHPTTPDVHVERDIRYTAGADSQLKIAKELLADLVRR